jgi:hypothetical protein
MKHGSTKNAFWDVNNKKWRKWCKLLLPFLFNNTYVSPVFTKDTKCTNQVFYVWLVDLHTLLNRASELDFFQIKIFVYVCSAWSKFELKTLFDTWITRNDVNGVSLFNLSYLITLRAYLCSQRTQNV